MFHTAATIRPIASLTTATGLIALLLAHPPLHAEPTQRSAIVRTYDLDLTRPEGQAQLDRRIRITARRLCQPDGSPALWRRREAAECRMTAIARAATARAEVIQRAGAH